jgi:hypothetical protein
MWQVFRGLTTKNTNHTDKMQKTIRRSGLEDMNHEKIEYHAKKDRKITREEDFNHEKHEPHERNASINHRILVCQDFFYNLWC